MSVQAVEVGAASIVRFHALVVRPDDDDPDAIIVGRPDLGEFVELPSVCGEVIRLLGEGRRVEDVEAAIAAEHDVELDVAAFVEALSDLAFVAEVDGRLLSGSEPAAVAGHFARVTERHVRWVFTKPMKLLWLAVVAAASVTVLTRGDLLPRHQDFFWSDYTGLSVLVNTAFFSVLASVHEMMHLIAARSLGAPARIGLSTRLHYLVVQTDVTAIWGVPRRRRYRVYLAGMASDVFLIAVMSLAVAFLPLPDLAVALLRAFTLTALLSLPLQALIYMRTDLYFVLRDLLRCKDLFGDGLGYVRHLLARAVFPFRKRGSPVTDPTAELPAHERRAVRIYALALGVGSSITLTVFAFYGAPIVVSALTHALAAIWNGFHGGPLLTAVDAALLILVEGGLQLLFLVTFVRGHRHWFHRRRS
ncbi:hypothetical protein [Nonomuraea jiangxiensis]|uniref:hypothetical protein n=1 Tax=Nonomuraea jiangxiensis TaxID=633440 RepID=UPI00115F9925|nr:hypothetical protein [Nonomuraea jiangxiensis]